MNFNLRRFLAAYKYAIFSMSFDETAAMTCYNEHKPSHRARFWATNYDRVIRRSPHARDDILARVEQCKLLWCNSQRNSIFSKKLTTATDALPTKEQIASATKPMLDFCAKDQHEDLDTRIGFAPITGATNEAWNRKISLFLTKMVARQCHHNSVNLVMLILFLC